MTDQDRKASIRRAFAELAAGIRLPPPCRHCGRCVLAGPPCCDGMAADARARAEERLREQSRAVSARQAERRARKAERRAAYEARTKGVGSGDG